MEEPWHNIEQFKALLREVTEKQEGNLKFKAKFLAVSEIAAQYYCEKGVELERIYGKEETPAMKLGTEAHELLLKDSIRAKREKTLEEIASGRPLVVRHMLLLGKHDGVIIAGKPDAILFYKGNPIYLFEHKFSNRQFPFTPHHVQAGLYCYLLRLMGWDTDNLRYVLVMAPPECKADEQLMKLPFMIFKEPGRETSLMKLRCGDARLYLYNFNINRTIESLNWAFGFWKQERPAKPTSKPAKCRQCEFHGKCDSMQH